MPIMFAAIAKGPRKSIFIKFNVEIWRLSAEIGPACDQGEWWLIKFNLIYAHFSQTYFDTKKLFHRVRKLREIAVLERPWALI